MKIIMAILVVTISLPSFAQRVKENLKQQGLSSASAETITPKKKKKQEKKTSVSNEKKDEELKN